MPISDRSEEGHGVARTVSRKDSTHPLGSAREFAQRDLRSQYGAMEMSYRTLGGTGMDVSALCLGTMMLGKVGNPDHDEGVRLIHAALDHGINFIDTADMYSHGESETIVGKAVRGRRDDVILATKGHFPLSDDPGPNEGGNSRRYLMRAIDASLERLQTDWIDLYQVHRPDWHTDLEETLSVLTDAVRAGKIRAFGCSTYPAHTLVEARAVAERRGLMRFRTEQPPYSLLARGIERDLLPVAQAEGMGVLTWSPLAFGLLTGQYRKGVDVDLGRGRAALRPAWFDPSDPETSRKMDYVEQFAELADDLGVALPSLAVAFPIAHPGVTSVILGPRTADQLENLVAGADLVLTDEILDRIDQIVAPGVNIYDPNGPLPPPWLTDAGRRRRPESDRAGLTRS